MEAYQERVVEEQSRLEKQIFRLMGFLAVSRPDTLTSVEEAGLLYRQLDCMKKYSAILLERIGLWGI